jgi:Flp pilus assembly protein TadD
MPPPPPSEGAGGQPRRSRRRLVLFGAITLVLLVGGAVAALFYYYRTRDRLPEPGTPRYNQYVEAFFVGTAALEAGLRPQAEEDLTRAVELVPGEPAGWANRGILYMRTDRRNEAARDLKKAQKLAPDNAHIEMLLGLLAERRGQTDEAINHLKRASELNPNNPAIHFQLAKLYGMKGNEGEAARQVELDAILKAQPNNMPALIERLVGAYRQQDRATIRPILARLNKLSEEWKAEKANDARAKLKEVARAVAQPFRPQSVNLINQLGYLLQPEIDYARSNRLLSRSGGQEGEPFFRFLRMKPPRTTAAAPDTELRFKGEPLPGHGGPGAVALPVWLTGDGPPVVFVADGKEVRQVGGKSAALPFPGGPKAVPPGPHGLLAIDWNNSSRSSLLCAGAGGLRFYEQDGEGKFQDVTEKTGLSKEALHGDYYGAWAADIEADGDLDVVLARRSGPPLVLRNNGKGIWTALELFKEVKGARAFAWADLDGDGAPDAAFLDKDGNLHVYMNERMAEFTKRAPDGASGTCVALAVADLNDDGVLDLVALRSDGALLRISDRNRREGWEVAQVATGGPRAGAPGAGRLFVADLDNNGALDVIASGPDGAVAWLGDENGTLASMPLTLQGNVQAAVDLNGDGRLDLLALDDGRPVRRLNSGSKNYHWQSLRLRHDPKEKPDGRINSFGIGAEVEVRTGTFVAKQAVDSPVVHFGVGERSKADVIRILWPNGFAQYELAQEVDQTLRLLQRLGGSCPFLFTWDGQRMVFVADCLWSGPLGMSINSQDAAGALQTTDWVRIRGDQLVPRNGRYDVRISATLWEADYFDHVSLIVVDHPADTEAFVDERFFMDETKPQVYLTTPPRPVARVWDDGGNGDAASAPRGEDVTEFVRTIDGRYLDRFGRGKYQGVTRPHFIDIDLGEDVPREGPVYLLLHGFIHPTDASINVALAQAGIVPFGMQLWVPDGSGGWKLARDKLGIPAGKNKTVVLRLDGLDGPGVSRRVRLRTNMELYWDAISYARGLDAKRCVQTKLHPISADLRHRGILQITKANDSSPELPHYDRVVTRGQYWRDQVGFFTRFGDVRELLRKVDDRYVIMNAGDELTLEFEAPPGPRPGWKRTFVWVSDGWTKDANPNTRFGTTVLPLPYHGMTRYERPGRLADDPLFRHKPHLLRDWDTYHTRYVTPADFERGLRLPARP